MGFAPGCRRTEFTASNKNKTRVVSFLLRLIKTVKRVMIRKSKYRQLCLYGLSNQLRRTVRTIGSSTVRMKIYACHIHCPTLPLFPVLSIMPLTEQTDAIP